MKDLAWARAHVDEADRLGRLQASVMRDRSLVSRYVRALRDVCDRVEIISGGDGRLEPFYHIVVSRKGNARHVTIDESETGALHLAFAHWTAT